MRKTLAIAAVALFTTASAHVVETEPNQLIAPLSSDMQEDFGNMLI